MEGFNLTTVLLTILIIIIPFQCCLSKRIRDFVFSLLSLENIRENREKIMFVLKRLHYVILYGIAFIIIFILLLIVFLPTPSDETISSHWHHLMKPSKTKYSLRVLDDGDEMPDIYCLNNKTAIKKVLQNKELITEMLKGLAVSRAPCVASYHFKKKNETRMPHFLILNNR